MWLWPPGCRWTSRLHFCPMCLPPPPAPALLASPWQVTPQLDSAPLVLGKVGHGTSLALTTSGFAWPAAHRPARSHPSPNPRGQAPRGANLAYSPPGSPLRPASIEAYKQPCPPPFANSLSLPLHHLPARPLLTSSMRLFLFATGEWARTCLFPTALTPAPRQPLLRRSLPSLLV